MVKLIILINTWRVLVFIKLWIPPLVILPHLPRLRSGLFLRRRPESPQDYVAPVIFWRPADAEMGSDLRDRRLSVIDRRSAVPVVVHWVGELIRSLSNMADASRLHTGPWAVRNR